MLVATLDFLQQGLLDFSVWQVVLATLLLTHLTIVSVTVYLHRYSAHRAISLHPLLQHAFRFWLWLTSATSTKEWTAIHRKHHAKCETEEDPHSPVVLGIDKVLWQGAEVYREAALDQETLERYGAGCPNDWLERHLYSPWKNSGIVLMLAIDLLCFGVLGITVWAIQMIWIPFFAAGVINGLAHHRGYRNFETRDAATNLVPWGILIGGEELHNNHHTYPGSAKLSIRRWEFDIGYAYIRLFAFLRLAEVNKLPPRSAFDINKQTLDIDTLRALVSNRFQVMAHFRRQVILPILQDENLSAETQPRLLAQARKLLHRDEESISQQARTKLASLVEDHDLLSALYQYRLRLQEITGRASRGAEDTLESLKQWVADAEASGIEALQDFARQLQSYVPAATARP